MRKINKSYAFEIPECNGERKAISLFLKKTLRFTASSVSLKKSKDLKVRELLKV